MANTIIQLKHSTVQGNVPVSLANGEISINTRDGKFFYADPTGTIQEFTEFPGPSGLNQEIQFNDGGVLGANSGLTFNKTTGVFNAPIVASSNNGNGTNFKVGDDAWIGDVNVADSLRISGQQNSANAYVIFGSSDSSKLGRAGTGPLTYTGAFTATGAVSGNELTSTQSSGDEGGQVNLAIPATNTNLTGQVTIDIYQNKLRFFQGDSAKGAYIDLTVADAGVGTNLLNPSATPDTIARNTANAAFITANAAFLAANAATATDATQNNSIIASFNHANAAYAQANTNTSDITVIQSVNVRQNNRITYAENHANAAFNAANTVTGGNSFGRIFTSNNSTFANAITSTDQITFTGVDGVSVAANAITKTVVFAGTPGAQGLTVDYGLVTEPIAYSLDYGTL
jgi:hypothetical protein